jgi:dienelactone hydrolase
MLKAVIAIISGLLATALLAGPLTDASKSPLARAPLNCPPFLDVFRAPDVAIVNKRVAWTSDLGTQRGWLVRPDSNEQLPALLIIDGEPASDFSLQSARELAGIGYVVLVVELDRNASTAPGGAGQSQLNEALLRERGLAQLSSATRWLQSRPDIFPDKIGVLGWRTQGRWALEVAAAQKLQAAVLIDAEFPSLIDPPLSVGLSETSVLLVCGTAQATDSARDRLADLERALSAGHIRHLKVEFKTAKPNFMESRQIATYDAKSADRAWFEIYEFVGKYVEDAGPKTTSLGSKPGNADASRALPAVSIFDVMRAINGPGGIRGAVAQSLNDVPREAKDWKLLRARAAIMTDSGTSLQSLNPPRGDGTHWQRHVAAYRDAAAALVAAADRNDLADARRAFDRLNGTCTKCHADHR